MSEIIVGKSTSGDFVHKNQQMASDVGFKNVAKAWYNKTISLDEGIERLEKFAEKRQDIVGDKSALMPTIINDKIAFQHKDGRNFVPTEHAWNSICTRYNLPQTILRHYYEGDKQDVELLLNILENSWRKVKKTDKFLFRTYNDGTLRAMLTDSYAVIDNIWFLKSLKKIFNRIGNSVDPRLSHYERSDGDTIYGNLLIPDTVREEKDSDYGGMLSIANCEVGTRRLLSLPSVFRAICMNGCIWGQEKGKALNKVHRGDIDYGDMEYMLRQNIEKQIPLISAGIDHLLSAKDKSIDAGIKRANTIAVVAKDYSLTRKFATEIGTQWAQNEGSNHNAFGLINAITRAGQKFSNQEWVKADEIGGELMLMPVNRWNQIVNKAANLSREEVMAAFAL